MQILSGLTQNEIEKFLEPFKVSKFRARQIHQWIYAKFASSFDEMTDLSKNLREELKQAAIIPLAKIAKKQVSSDGTVKYLLEYQDGSCVETVLMRFDNRANLTACVSSQVGCAMGCAFCQTGKRGFIRNLTSQEIIEQILTIQRDLKVKVTNVVFMGQGEPLLNFDNVLNAIELLNNELTIGSRRITVSTCGIVPKIKELADMDFRPTLAISLHSPSTEVRQKIMPVEKKYNLTELKAALKYFTEKTGNRITIEYTLIGGINDDILTAQKLAKFLKDLKCNINLIIYNPIKNDEFKRPAKEDIYKFKYIMESSGKKVTTRLERGADIAAACGQLAGE